MKKLFILIFAFFLLNVILFGQTTTNQIGQLKFIDCKITKTENIIDTISGHPVKMARLTITAKTKIQMSCNYGDPSKNKYETINNKIAISYNYDSTTSIRDSIINEIKRYVSEKEAWAKEYNSSSDFSGLTFHKSLFLKGNIITPYVRTMGERPGDYQLFYVDRHVYKIELLECNGLGCISSFVSQNMYFVRNNKRIDLGEYIKNTDTLETLLEKVK